MRLNVRGVLCVILNFFEAFRSYLHSSIFSLASMYLSFSLSFCYYINFYSDSDSDSATIFNSPSS